MMNEQQEPDQEVQDSLEELRGELHEAIRIMQKYLGRQPTEDEVVNVIMADSDEERERLMRKSLEN